MSLLRVAVLGATCLSLAAAPAAAERRVCTVSRLAGGILSQTGAVIDPAFDRLLVQTGPINTDLVMRPETGLAPIPEAAEGANLYVYWYGDEAPGKSWRDPGSITFALAAFAIQWPILQDAKAYRMHGMRAVYRMGEAVSDRWVEIPYADYAYLSQEVMPVHNRMDSEWPNDWEHRLVFSDEYPAWTAALLQGGRLDVELYSYNDLLIGTAAFDLPPLEAFRQRAILDIQDFRANVDPVACPAGPRDTLP